MLAVLLGRHDHRGARARMNHVLQVAHGDVHTGVLDHPVLGGHARGQCGDLVAAEFGALDTWLDRVGVVARR